MAECLKRLQKQTVVQDIEVIVVSDGPDAETKKIVEDASFFYFDTPKSQQGIARNEGVKHAKSKYVLFIGDDIFLEKNACEIHLDKFMNRYPVTANDFAVLGFTTWDPACEINEVMRWLETSGWQFGYPMLATYKNSYIPSDIQHKFTYTSHISLPLEVAQKFPFRSDVSLYGWEDIEWGIRLRDAGIKLLYEPDAKGLHHHHIEMEDSLKRMETLGRSAKEIAKISPAFDRVPKGWKLLVYRILAKLPTMSGSHRKAFLRGLSSNGL